MAQPSTFVPAWKRLGLKLKKFEEAENNHHQPDEQENGHYSPPEDGPLQKEGDLSQSTKNKSKLGKRKHHSDSNAIESASVKKTKSDDRFDPTNGHAVATVPDVVLESLKSAAGDATPADTAPSKGDSNYRKKKAGDSNYRKKKEPKHAQAVSQDLSQLYPTTIDYQRQSERNLAAPQILRTPSLSPSQQDIADSSILLPSTEVDLIAPTTLVTPKRQKNGVSSKDNTLSLSPPKTERRKSVTFTPDTKTSDGNSASNLFKKWVTEQKGSSADFTPAEVAQFTEPPKVHIANSNPPSSSETPKNTVVPKGKKKDPSRYLDYLTRYHKDRENWKFNKATQNDILDNATNIFRIPDEYSEALLEYVKGLQGAGIRARMGEKWTKTISEINQAEREDPMDDREAMKEAALQERLSKERKRRRLEGDIQAVENHPYPEGFVRRLKRRRAEALCSALRMDVPVSTPQSGLKQAAKQTTFAAVGPVAQTNARTVKRAKRRTDISSDESSDSSSSEEESSSDDSSDDDSDDESSSESSSADESSSTASSGDENKQGR